MIYLIKSGSYSDVEIHGYFTNEEDAYEYCELVKQKYLSAPAGAWHLDLYVEPVPEMQVEFPKERLSMLYQYTVVFNQVLDVDSNKLKWDCLGVIGSPHVLADRPHLYRHEWHMQKTGILDSISVYVSLEHPNREKALKIAQDYFAQLRAEGKIDD